MISVPARRMTAAWAAAVLTVAGAAVVTATRADAAPAPASVEPAQAGGYVPLAKPVRVLDTRTGLRGNHAGAVAGGEVIKPRVVGFGSLPQRGVGSVVLSLRALDPSATGGLVAYRSARPATTTLRFTRGVAAVAATTVVPVRPSGRITIANQATGGAANIAAEVVGYYRAGAPSRTDHGVFHPLRTATRAATVTLGAGASRPLLIGGAHGVPADAGAVATTLTVSGTRGDGTVSAWRVGDPVSTLPAVRYRAGEQVSGFTVAGLGGGKFTLRNNGAAAVRVTVDVSGYYTEGVAQTAGALRPLSGANIANLAVPGGGRATVRTGGAGGVPLARVRAAVVTISVASPASSGVLQLSRSGSAARSDSAAVVLRRGVPVTATVVAPLSKGRFTLFSTAADPVRVSVDVHGYVPADTLRPPKTDVGRYPNTLTGDIHYDSAVLRDAGAADARAGSTFTLLDLGAQTVTEPVASREHPGIVLALTGDKRIVLTYADAVTDITAYLRGYAAAAPGQQVTVAVGTNNDGVFDSKDPDYYTPAARGRDYASAVIEPLRQAAPQGVTVLGANDIESGFASDQYQALEWENAYLDTTSADLVYNGSLDGCPTTFGGTGACNYEWTQAQYVQLTSNRGRVRVLPQIYIRDQSIQWANIDRASGNRLRYAGVLTESLDPDTFTPEQGWTAFVRALATVRTTLPVAGLRSVDIEPDSKRS